MMFTALLWIVVANAAPEVVNEPPKRLEHVTVEASKAPLAVGELASRVTVIEAEQIETELAQTIGDLVRYEPGVDVSSQGSRFGLSGFSIRGVGGNRVQIEVDGVAASDAFSIGSFSNASRDFVDVDALKQVEIIRGPSSAVFGSDALGGVVSFVTRDPDDYLQGRPQHIDFSAGYNGVDNSSLVRGTAALSFGQVSALLRLSHRDGQQMSTPRADPLAFSTLNVMAKLAYGNTQDGGPVLALEHFDSERTTDVNSLERAQDFTAIFGFPYEIQTTEVSGDDWRDRRRISVRQDWTKGVLGLDYLRWRGYTQRSRTRQDTFEARNTRISGVDNAVARDRLFQFEQVLSGLELNAMRAVRIGAFEHRIGFGAEFEVAETEQLRDGLETDLATGVVSPQVGPDLYPVRDFPVSRTRRSGIYLEDRWRIGELTFIPGVRWDRYTLAPDADPVFTAGNPGIVPVRLETSRVSPKFGLLWDVGTDWQIYGQYAEGFRAPPVNDVNVGFTNFQFGYTTLPNPNLESESSAGLEIGLRQTNQTRSIEFSVYATRYDDFIASFQSVGVDSLTGLLQFQSINLDDVEIRGAEFQSSFWPRALPEGVVLKFSAAWAKGEDRLTGAPLNTIAPLNAVIGVGYTEPQNRWGINMATRLAARQDDTDQSAGPLLIPAGYVVHDLMAFYRPSANLRLRGGLYNVADTNFTSYLDVAGLDANVANPERFSRPGRELSVALDWQF